MSDELTPMQKLTVDRLLEQVAEDNVAANVRALEEVARLRATVRSLKPKRDTP